VSMPKTEIRHCLACNGSLTSFAIGAGDQLEICTRETARLLYVRARATNGIGTRTFMLDRHGDGEFSRSDIFTSTFAHHSS